MCIRDSINSLPLSLLYHRVTNGHGLIDLLGHGKEERCSQALPPQNLLQLLFSFSFSFLIRSKVTKYMPMVRKNMNTATFIALLHLLCGQNALNLTVTTV